MVFTKIFQLVANKNPSSFEIPDCRNMIKTTPTLCPTGQKTTCLTFLSPSNPSEIRFVDVARGISAIFGAGNLPRSEVQVGQHQFLRGVVALPFNG